VGGEKHLGGVLDFAQSALAHFVDAKLGCGAEAVFDGTEQTVYVLSVTFEV
jgi:hypothetical protein